MRIDVDSITIANATRVLASGRAAIEAGDRVIDFTSVVRCDTTAVACVIAWLRIAGAGAKPLQFIALPHDLRSLARLYGVEALIGAS